MTTDEIFQQIAEHIIRGLMVHSQLADCYHFLGLSEFAREQEQHYIEESKSYRCIVQYYMKSSNKLLKLNAVTDPKVIPNNWYMYTRQDVDPNTKRSFVKTGLETWIEWESGTKQFLEHMHRELISIGEDTYACKIMELIHNVNKELCIAQDRELNFKAIDYDITNIISLQYY